MKKAFTLIELLAVIVILAIIALIAVPIILNIINSTKKESIDRSEELYLSAVKNAIARKNLNEPNKEFNPTICKVNKDGNLSCTLGEEVVTLNIEVEGEKPCSGIVVIDNGKIESETVSFDCYYVDDSGASAPDLMDTLTPVVYENDKWIVADPASEWYDYDNGKWANAVILKENVDKKIGDTINIPNSSEVDTSDALAMFVWIPRYSYTIKEKYGRKLNEDDNEPTKELPGAIDIKFVGTKVKDNGSASYIDEIGTSWYTHPAFTFGGVELSGIWVGKFETTGTKDNPTILPNQSSLRGQTISKQFETAKKFNKDITGDSHMMKNSEWGAVAYLSQSIYGKYGNDKEEVHINNCSSYITGIGADTVDAPSSSDTCSTDKNKYNGESGVKASTTGNITGIYDMSGGAYEYVMGYLTTSYTTDVEKNLPWGSTLNSNGAGFTEAIDTKYFDNYTSTTKASACNNEICYGHSLSETESWYRDTAIFVSTSSPWVTRGGYEPYGTSAGVFNSHSYTGVAVGWHAFRVVLSPNNY